MSTFSVNEYINFSPADKTDFVKLEALKTREAAVNHLYFIYDSIKVSTLYCEAIKSFSGYSKIDVK